MIICTLALAALGAPARAQDASGAIPISQEAPPTAQPADQSVPVGPIQVRPPTSPPSSVPSSRPSAQPSYPPMGNYTPPKAPLMTWMNKFFNTDGWVARAKYFGLLIGVTGMGLIFITAGLVAAARPQSTGNGAQEILGQFAGTIIQSLPMLLYILVYDKVASKAVDVSCNAAYGAMTAITYVGGGNAPPFDGGGNTLCSHQLSPISVLATGTQLIFAVMNLQVPTPQLNASGNGWSWVFAPIVNAAADNFLVGLIQWSTAAVVAGVFIYIAIEILGFALEAPFVTALAPMFLGFRFIPGLEYIAEGAKRYLPNFAIRLFFVLLPASLCVGLVTAETAAVNGSVSFSDLLALLGSIVVCAVFVIRIKDRVQHAILTGESTTSGWKDLVIPAATTAAEVAAIVATGGLALGAGIEAFAALGGAGGAAGAGMAEMELPLAHATADAYGTGSAIPLQPPPMPEYAHRGSGRYEGRSNLLSLPSGGGNDSSSPSTDSPSSPPSSPGGGNAIDLPRMRDGGTNARNNAPSPQPQPPPAPTQMPNDASVQQNVNTARNDKLAADAERPNASINSEASSEGVSWRLDPATRARYEQAARAQGPQPTDTARAQAAHDSSTHQRGDSSSEPQERQGPRMSPPATTDRFSGSRDSSQQPTEATPQPDGASTLDSGDDFIDAQFTDDPPVTPRAPMSTGERLGRALLHSAGHYTALRATFGGKGRHIRRHRMFAYMLGIDPGEHQASVLSEQSELFRNLFNPTSDSETP